MSGGRGPRDRLIVALDVPTPGEARALVDRLAGAVGMFKVGSQLFTEAGPGLRAGAARARREGVPRPQVPRHPQHGGERGGARGRPRRLAAHRARPGRPRDAGGGHGRPARGGATRVLAITVLTSHSEASLAELGLGGPLQANVERLARLAQLAQVDGVVASPHEIARIRAACGRDFLVVTPGIRPAGSETGDQARAATPEAAVPAGADYIVVGRPILTAPDPRAAAEAIVAGLPRVLNDRRGPERLDPSAGA